MTVQSTAAFGGVTLERLRRLYFEDAKEKTIYYLVDVATNENGDPGMWAAFMSSINPAKPSTIMLMQELAAAAKGEMTERGLIAIDPVRSIDSALYLHADKSPIACEYQQRALDMTDLKADPTIVPIVSYTTDEINGDKRIRDLNGKSGAYVLTWIYVDAADLDPITDESVKGHVRRLIDAARDSLEPREVELLRGLHATVEDRKSAKAAEALRLARAGELAAGLDVKLLVEEVHRLSEELKAFKDADLAKKAEKSAAELAKRKEQLAKTKQRSTALRMRDDLADHAIERMNEKRLELQSSAEPLCRLLEVREDA